MTQKLRSEMSSQKIDTSADIRFGSQTLLEGFVILDLKSFLYPPRKLCLWEGILFSRCLSVRPNESPTVRP